MTAKGKPSGTATTMIVTAIINASIKTDNDCSDAKSCLWSTNTS